MKLVNRPIFRNEPPVFSAGSGLHLRGILQTSATTIHCHPRPSTPIHCHLTPRPAQCFQKSCATFPAPAQSPAFHEIRWGNRETRRNEPLETAVRLGRLVVSMSFWRIRSDNGLQPVKTSKAPSSPALTIEPRYLSKHLSNSSSRTTS